MTDSDERVPAPILRTKLHRHSLTGDLVTRNRLTTLLDRRSEVPLTLVSAPAGYGKSVLVSQWAEERGHPTAWVSLDDGDSDLKVFLLYLLAAVDTLHPGACPATRELLEAPQLGSPSILADHLINELDLLEGPLSIVLDDYHSIDSASPVHTLVDRVLEFPPRQVHLILTTRRDPPLSLANLRADNRFTEIRLEDLRFTSQESAELLALALDLVVSDDSLANLQHEIEGWAAGLRLVSLALRHAEDPAARLSGLHMGSPQTQEYLVEEVLAHQSPAVRDFMLRSSVLDRFCADLLDALFEHDGETSPPETSGHELLGLLHRNNLFTLGLDAGGEWFRYHHLFRDLLRRLLQRDVSQSEVAALQRRAATWYEAHGMIEDAIRYSLAAGDAEGAADLVERHRFVQFDRDRWYIVKGWLRLLPENLRHRRLSLLLTQGLLAFYEFDLELAQTVVERVKSQFDEKTMEPAEAAQFDHLRGVLAYWEGNGADSRKFCERAAADLPAELRLIASETRTYRALARHMAGEDQAILDDLDEECRTVDPSDDLLFSRLTAARLFVQLLSGRLTAAARCARGIWDHAARLQSTYAKVWSRFPEALAHLHSFDLDAALEGYLFVVERRDFFERVAAVDALAGLALTYQFQQAPDQALKTAEEMAAFAHELGAPEHTAVARSTRARLALLQGDLEAAIRWARSADPEAHAPSLFFWLEAPPITLLRVQIREGTRKSLNAALETLSTLRPQVEALHLSCQSIELLVLQALALEKQGREGAGMETLNEALAAARPGGWVRPFVEAGPVMAAMLQRLTDQEGDRRDLRRLLAAFDDPVKRPPVEPPSTMAATPRSAPRIGSSRPGGRPAPDTLTNREIDILELLAQRYQNKEIAARLFISTHTVNDHLKQVYQKLAVNNRRQAVEQAVRKGILQAR